MINYLEKSLIKEIYNTNEFKGWLLSRRWFGDKYALSKLDFEVDIEYFQIISERILLTIINVKTPHYSKAYFLPVVYYRKLIDILQPSEKGDKEAVLLLTDNTFSKKIVLNIGDQQKIFTVNLIEGEYCIFFWKNMLFDKKITEKFPAMQLALTLYEDQFEDEENMRRVQTLIEASLYPDRYSLSLKRLGGGNTTNNLFLLRISNIKSSNQKPAWYVLKIYKEYIESLEASTLIVLVKNNFPNAPKIYGTIKLKDKETIGVMESVPNVGNIGDIYWTELNNMINNTFKNLDDDYSKFNEKTNISKLIKNNCAETLKVSEQIGKYITSLHKALIIPEDKSKSLETVQSTNYLKNYTEKLNLMITELQHHMTHPSGKAFFNLPKLSIILIEIKDIIERFRREFDLKEIKIQPIHQDLHMEQILYNKVNDHYEYYFIDFEGDPQLKIEEKRNKFPVEKDLASFLRALSYIKFNTLLGFIERKIIQKDKFEVPEEILYNIYFRKALKPVHETLDVVLKVLNAWEMKLMTKILKTLSMHTTLITYYYIHRALYELNYEILFRPDKIIVPILGLKEILDRN